jgi:hypothetical protein
MSSNTGYRNYLERFDELVGIVEVGQVGTFQGKLVKKLSSSAYEQLQTSYDGLLDEFKAMVRRSQTIDERVMMSIRRAELELLIERSPVLP